VLQFKEFGVMEDMFHISSLQNTKHVSIQWHRSAGISDFIFQVMNAFEMPDDASFVLIDVDGDMMVLSPSIRPGYYRLKITNNNGTLRSIVQSYRSQDESGHGDQGSSSVMAVVDDNDSNFETRLIRVACADALIANERTWLAWTRTSLNIMTVSIWLSTWIK
jgi:hypothetical protein